MRDKQAKNDGRRIWERVLSSVPHGLAVRTISVSADGKDEERFPDREAPPPKPVLPRPLGPE